MLGFYVMSTDAARPAWKVQFQMLGPTHDLKIAWRIVQGVSIHVMNMFTWLQLSFKKPLHDDTMFRLVVAMRHIYVAIAVFDICASKEARAHWLTVPSEQGVMVVAQAFRPRVKLASFDGTGIAEMAIDFFSNRWVTVSIQAGVMRMTQPSRLAWVGAILKCAKRFRFGHVYSLRLVVNRVKHKGVLSCA